MVEKLGTFTFKDPYGWSESQILDEAQACATRRAEVMGWIGVFATRSSSPAIQKEHSRYYEFEIWGKRLDSDQ